jgi:hypothetical protein
MVGSWFIWCTHERPSVRTCFFILAYRTPWAHHCRHCRQTTAATLPRHACTAHRVTHWGVTSCRSASVSLTLGARHHGALWWGIGEHCAVNQLLGHWPMRSGIGNACCPVQANLLETANDHDQRIQRNASAGSERARCARCTSRCLPSDHAGSRFRSHATSARLQRMQHGIGCLRPRSFAPSVNGVHCSARPATSACDNASVR